MSIHEADLSALSRSHGEAQLGLGYVFSASHGDAEREIRERRAAMVALTADRDRAEVGVVVRDHVIETAMAEIRRLRALLEANGIAP